MTDGYRQAANLLVERAAEERGARDFLLYPIIFSYRHFLELSLKSMLLLYGRQVDIFPVWDDHDLGRLWRLFEAMIGRYETDHDNDAFEAVKTCVAEFAHIDPNSFAFRYPVDRKGQPVEIDMDRIDLLQLRDVMEGIHGYFMGTDGYLDNLTANEPDYEGDY
jgi:hypothetical protein